MLLLVPALLALAFPTGVHSFTSTEDDHSPRYPRSVTEGEILNEGEISNEGNVYPGTERRKTPFIKIELWYISKPNSVSTDMLCRANKSCTVLQIVCPHMDREVEDNKVDIIMLRSSTNETVALPCITKPQDNQYHVVRDNGYSSVERRLPLESVGKVPKLSCFCHARISSRVSSNNPKVEVQSTRFQTNDTKIVRRRINATKHIQLHCHVTGGPTLHVLWYKNGTPLQLNGTTAVDGFQYKYKNRVLKLSRRDSKISGDYRCLAWNMAGKVWGRHYNVTLHENHRRSSNSCVHGGLFSRNCRKIHAGTPRNDTDEDQEEHEKSHTSESMTRKVIWLCCGVALIILVVASVYSGKSQKCRRRTQTSSSCFPERQSSCRIRPRTMSTTPCLIGNIQISSSCFPDRQSFCHSRTCTTSITSDDSNLLAMLNDVPPEADGRYFASALIDHNGGQVILDDTGIKLVIPNGALPEGKTKAVFIALIEKEQYFPQLDHGESLLSHVVMCGPHGLRFKKHVLLILPHWVAMQGDSKFRVLCSDTAPEEDTNWAEIYNTETGVNDDCFCSMDEGSFSLFVSHFSWYAIPGECKSKTFCLASYHSSSHEPPEMFRIRIYCMPDVEKYHKQVEKIETQYLKGVMCEAMRPIIIYENGGKLLINNAQISEGWQFVNDQNQEITYPQMWNCMKTAPVAQYYLDGDSQLKVIYCVFKVVQEELQIINKPEEITISAVFPLPSQAVPESPGIPSLPRRSSSGYPSSGESTIIRFLPRPLIEELMLLLDPPILGKYPYRILAEKLNFHPRFGKWLQEGAKGSPTEHLLSKWEHTVKTSPEQALRELTAIFRDMGRDDAIEAVQRLCGLCITHPKETIV